MSDELHYKLQALQLGVLHDQLKQGWLKLGTKEVCDEAHTNCCYRTQVLDFNITDKISGVRSDPDMVFVQITALGFIEKHPPPRAVGQRGEGRGEDEGDREEAERDQG